MSLHIVQLPPDALTALAAGDLAAAEAVAPVPLTPWLASPENAAVWRRRAEQVQSDPADLPWVTGVLWDDVAGVAVELGYAVDPAHRRRGHARGALEAAIVRAQDDPGVRVLRVTVSPDNLPSLGLVEQYAFVRSGEQWDDQDGLELIFEMPV